MEELKNPKILARLDRALDLLESAEIAEGVNMLKMCEEHISLTDQIEADIKLITVHNLAMCYQLMQDYEECGKYLEKTIQIAKCREFSQDIEKIRNCRYLCMLYIQLAAIMSHLGDHLQSVSHAKQAFTFVSQSLQQCISISSSMKSLSDTSFQNFKTLETILLYLSGNLQKFPLNCKKIVQRSPLGVLHLTDWIFSFTINDVLDIKPLKYFEVKNSHTFQAELSKDFMLEKVCLLITSCYLIATESRLMEDHDKVKKAKGWHMRAVEIGNVLLPPETPLLQHVKMSFDKHYPAKVAKKVVKVSKSKTPIKETHCVSSRNKTPVITKGIMQRKVIKNVEVKTERSFIKEKNMIAFEKAKEIGGKWKTNREDNQEPEPPISEDYDEESNKTFIISSNELYGFHSDD